MTTEIKVRTWIWVTFATVVILGGGFTYWNVKGNKSTVSPTVSPTPTIISKVSPSASAKTTATPTGEQTPSTTATPSVETKSWEGKLGIKDPNGSTNLSCIPTISFEYPQDSTVTIQGGTPSVAGWTNIIIRNGDISSAIVSNESYERGTYTTAAKCIDQPYENLTDFINRNEIIDYKLSTINGLSVIQYTDPKSSRKTTAIQNTNKTIVSIAQTNGTDLVTNTIANSLRFK
ncbi:MAG: Ocelliless [Berkelbacteria bacterium GW2011_GWA1_36_9]|uniref:Ocelliless n=1 Tax=Berkelbacteria bacterium GW2011_GWA1_36_9 TaxID=1618331 RepID=A0A0G0FI25_9BACT|nr:MAG: Ocelliless [Berkelbacteria bacterium GW2011_GWA1_36_9]